MATPWLNRFGLFLCGWLLVGVATLFSLGLWDPMFYFMITAVGFLLAMEYSEPLERPTGHRRLGWLAVLILGVFANIVITWIESTTGIALL